MLPYHTLHTQHHTLHTQLTFPSLLWLQSSFHPGRKHSLGEWVSTWSKHTLHHTSHTLHIHTWKRRKQSIWIFNIVDNVIKNIIRLLTGLGWGSLYSFMLFDFFGSFGIFVGARHYWYLCITSYNKRLNELTSHGPFVSFFWGGGTSSATHPSVLSWGHESVKISEFGDNLMLSSIPLYLHPRFAQNNSST